MSDPIEKMYVPDGPEDGGTGSAGIPCPLCGNGRLRRPPSLQAIEEAATKYYVIPRAEYEAYRAAAEALRRLCTKPESFVVQDWIEAEDACAALRAASIHETEGGER